MGIIALSKDFFNMLQAYSKRCFKTSSHSKPPTPDFSTKININSKDDLQVVEKSDTIENYNSARLKRWVSLIGMRYQALMQNKLLMFCVVACSFICIIQFLFFIIYWTDIVPRKTQKAIGDLNYDYLTNYLKKQCVPYNKILDQCIL
ncbi:hypothetical protein SUVZ_07G0280 [Saccharomyces uvarum]|uniref:Uncharacterized protein n=1 Tax=Saccharomyces uvarum TaxID=230603 RepID=A0ABN8WYU7_SACUV|nr:hypothetical protein SUVZ_07G0280 [Saccharomyces uvarum]